MSLFENDRFRWRETFFVMFLAENHPTIGAMQKVLTTLGGGIEISEARGEDGAGFESLTLIAHDDNAAMDIVYSAGEDVLEQRDELLRELTTNVDGDEEKAKLKCIATADARLEIFHFEETIWDPDMDENEEMLDPGTVLTVLDLLADFCDGVAVDPQSGTFL
jgi:hypothetical protein